MSDSLSEVNLEQEKRQKQLDLFDEVKDDPAYTVGEPHPSKVEEEEPRQVGIKISIAAHEHMVIIKTDRPTDTLMFEGLYAHELAKAIRKKAKAAVKYSRKKMLGE